VQTISQACSRFMVSFILGNPGSVFAGIQPLANSELGAFRFI